MKRYANSFALMITAPGFLDEVEEDLHLESKEFYKKHREGIATVTDNWNKMDCRILAAKVQDFLQEMEW